AGADLDVAREKSWRSRRVRCPQHVRDVQLDHRRARVRVERAVALGEELVRRNGRPREGEAVLRTMVTRPARGGRIREPPSWRRFLLNRHLVTRMRRGSFSIRSGISEGGKERMRKAEGEESRGPQDEAKNSSPFNGWAGAGVSPTFRRALVALSPSWERV